MTSLYSLLPRKTTWQSQPSDCTVTNILQNAQEMETKPENIHLCTPSSTESTWKEHLQDREVTESVKCLPCVYKDLSLISGTYMKNSGMMAHLVTSALGSRDR